jgi:Mycothiol maleylpyruvate isomerase N-terminal domain
MNPRQPALPRTLALRLAGGEYDRCLEAFSSLQPAQRTAPTDCPAWNVRQMAAHMLGMVEMVASMRQNLRQHQPRRAT